MAACLGGGGSVRAEQRRLLARVVSGARCRAAPEPSWHKSISQPVKEAGGRVKAAKTQLGTDYAKAEQHVNRREPGVGIGVVMMGANVCESYKLADRGYLGKQCWWEMFRSRSVRM